MPQRRYSAKKRMSLGSPLIRYPVKGLNEKLPSVCGECNHGWMSELTGRMKERFSASILRGAHFSLSPRDAVILAAFTLMKAIVTDYGDGDDPFFTRAAREHLRTSLAIPAFVKMWFAAYQGSAKIGFRNSLYVITPNTPSILDGIEFLCHTYVVGNLAIQLLAPRWKHISDRRRKPLVSITPDSFWQPAAIQFWPCAGDVLMWPPEKYMGDNVIDQFIHRFEAPLKLPLR